MPKKITDFHKQAVDIIVGNVLAKGKFALVSTNRIDTGEEVIVLARLTEDNENYSFEPLAILFDENPMNIIAPPIPLRN